MAHGLYILEVNILYTSSLHVGGQGTSDKSQGLLCLMVRLAAFLSLCSVFFAFRMIVSAAGGSYWRLDGSCVYCVWPFPSCTRALCTAHPRQWFETLKHWWCVPCMRSLLGSTTTLLYLRRRTTARGLFRCAPPRCSLRVVANSCAALTWWSSSLASIDLERGCSLNPSDVAVSVPLRQYAPAPPLHTAVSLFSRRCA